MRRVLALQTNSGTITLRQVYHSDRLCSNLLQKFYYPAYNLGYAPGNTIVRASVRTATPAPTSKQFRHASPHFIIVLRGQSYNEIAAALAYVQTRAIYDDRAAAHAEIGQGTRLQQIRLQEAAYELYRAMAQDQRMLALVQAAVRDGTHGKHELWKHGLSDYGKKTGYNRLREHTTI